MSKIAVIYWSGTGNTEAMANAVAQGARGKGAGADLLAPGEVNSAALDAYTGIALGCPAMGGEALEEEEFEPMFEEVKRALQTQNVALFGSYGWGGGEWMRNWERDCRRSGISLCCESVICNEAPDDQTLAACRAMGEALSSRPAPV